MPGSVARDHRRIFRKSVCCFGGLQAVLWRNGNQRCLHDSREVYRRPSFRAVFTTATSLIFAQVISGCLSEAQGHDSASLPTYMDLAEHGRPVGLFRLETGHSDLCNKVVKELNEPFYEENLSPLQTLLHASSGISWQPKTVHTADGGKLSLLKVGVPDLDVAGDLFKVVSIRADIAAYPMEKITLVRKDSLEAAEDKAGLVRNEFVRKILNPNGDDAVRPINTWSFVLEKTESDEEQARYLPANTYTLNVLLIDRRLLAVLAPPYLFDTKGNLRDDLITFVISLSAPGNPLCYLTY